MSIYCTHDSNGPLPMAVTEDGRLTPPLIKDPKKEDSGELIWQKVEPGETVSFVIEEREKTRHKVGNQVVCSLSAL